MRIRVFAGYGALVVAFAFGLVQWALRGLDKAVTRSFKEER